MKEKVTSSLLRFIKTFIVHLTAKRALERHCFGCRDQAINLSLFAVDRPPQCIPARSWQKLQDILTNGFLSLLNSSSTSTGETLADTAARAIDVLQERIKNPRDYYSPRTKKLLEKFQKIIEGSHMRFTGGMHCETLLATLSKYFEAALKGRNDADLQSICKVLLFIFTYFLLDLTICHKALLKFAMISVSKLCCPVCWELLMILCKENPLSIRGSHSVISPVILPKWLPDDIVAEMYKRFLHHLGEELDIMLRHQGAKRSRHALHESESNISTASTSFPMELGKYYCFCY